MDGKKMLIQFFNKVFLNGSCRFSECNLGNLITDSMVDAYINRHIGSDAQWSDLSIGITNSGGKAIMCI